jgi:hypothetical protein
VIPILDRRRVQKLEPAVRPLTADPDVAADLDLEDPGQDSACTCECGPGSHTPDGCRAGDCLCPATWEEGLDAEDPENFEAEVALVTAALRADRARRKRLDNDRLDRVARDPASSPRGKNRPRVAPTKAATARSIVRKVAPSSLPAVAPPGYEDDGRILFEEDALEAVLAG